MGKALMTDMDAMVVEALETQALGRQLQKATSPLEAVVAVAERGSKLGAALWQVACWTSEQPLLMIVADGQPTAEQLSSYLAHFCLAAGNLLDTGDGVPVEWHHIAPQISWVRGEGSEKAAEGWPAEYRDYCLTSDRVKALVRCSGRAGVAAAEAEVNWRGAEMMAQALVERLGILVGGDQENRLLDPVSGVYSEAGFFAALEREIERTRRHATPLSMAALELVPLRGRSQLLEAVHRGVGEHLQKQVRKGDLVGRIGELSYGILLYHTGPRNALIAAGRIAEALRADELLQGTVTFSLGVSGWDCSGPEGLTLLSQARRAAAEAAAVAPGRPFIYL